MTFQVFAWDSNHIVPNFHLALSVYEAVFETSEGNVSAELLVYLSEDHKAEMDVKRRSHLESWIEVK